MGSHFVPERRPAGLLRDSVLVLSPTSAAAEASELADRDGSGIVLCGEDAVATGQALRDRGFDRPLLIDRRRYAGAARAFGTSRLSPAWIAAQRRLGTETVLTDSGYIGDGNLTALRSVLFQAADLDGDVTAVLPLHKNWLRTHLDLLITEVHRYGGPVALVLEDRNDPLNAAAAIRGLVKLLRSPANVALLGTDMSGLGALCFGARWAAIGIRSGLRHLYPLERSGGGPPQGPAAFVAPLLSFIGTARIARAWSASPDWPVWKCSCTTCEERTIDFLRAAARPDIDRHTFECLLDLRDGLVGLAEGALRQRSWQAKCGHALSCYDELKFEYRVTLEPPGMLRGWRAV